VGVRTLACVVMVGLSVLVVPARSHAQPKTNRWATMTSPSKGSAGALGEYSAGCLRGAAKLPMDGRGFQVMHPSRLRYYGTPDLIDFIGKLGKSLRAEGFGDLMIGDLSQPRGGPAPGGHSSHQTGLDVDIWYWQPAAATKAPLPRADRESLKARSVLDSKGTLRAEFAPRVAAMLRLAASDPRVTRMFVNPLIKKALCADAESDRAWLEKVRPWYGHDDHVHVRLACPAGVRGCVAQLPVPSGDGCSELGWWFDKAAQEDRAKGQATYQSKVGKSAGMPPECFKLLEEPNVARSPMAPTAPPEAAEPTAAATQAQPAAAATVGESTVRTTPEGQP
jgi:penicillin-insensitive murein endopeptidase